MPTARQRTTARKNIKKAQRTWRGMSRRAHSRAQPEGRARARPGTTGEGGFFHVEVRPKREFKTFRTQDVGEAGGIERVAGKRGSGTWDTQKWLIGKDHAHIERGRLVADTRDTRKILDTPGSAPAHVRGDRFKAAPRDPTCRSAKSRPRPNGGPSTGTSRRRRPRGTRHDEGRARQVNNGGGVAVSRRIKRQFKSEEITMRGMSKTTRHCIEECLRCYQTCLGTAMMHCLESGGEHVAPAHFRLMMSCAEICRSAAHEMLVGGTHAGRLCGLCADVCEQCAEDCERIGDMAECVDECRRCAGACRRMAGEDQGAKVGHEAAHQRH